jgi:hypothetical protein
MLFQFKPHITIQLLWEGEGREGIFVLLLGLFISSANACILVSATKRKPPLCHICFDNEVGGGYEG